MLNAEHFAEILKRAADEWEVLTGGGGAVTDWQFRQFLALKLADHAVVLQVISEDDIRTALTGTGLATEMWWFDLKAFKKRLAKIIGCRAA